MGILDPTQGIRSYSGKECLVLNAQKYTHKKEAESSACYRAVFAWDFIGLKKEMILKKNRMCATLICHFIFPSYATTSPMRIATIHSVHLPLFFIFADTISATRNILTAFFRKINS